MSDLQFEWDNQKAKINEEKHGVSFEEAKSIFYDDNARLTYDSEHSQNEERYVLLGISYSLRLLVVCHLYQTNNETIRIISARQATKLESKQYQGFLL